MLWRAFAVAPFLLLSPPSAAAGAIIPVLADPTATYEDLGRREMGPGIFEIITKRVGALGTSYARREVNCRYWTFRYTGNADTQEELAAQYVNSPFGPLEPGSVSYYIALEICRPGTRSAPSTGR